MFKPRRYVALQRLMASGDPFRDITKGFHVGVRVAITPIVIGDHLEPTLQKVGEGMKGTILWGHGRRLLQNISD